MTHRRRRGWAGTAIGAAVTAAVTLLAVQGCSPDPAADAVTHPSHVVSLAQAERIYNHYVAATDEAVATGDMDQALNVSSAVQWSEAKAQYTALATAGTPVPRYRYGKPVFYVPALSGYPEWFVVAVPRRTDTGGQLSAAVTTLMLFTQRNETVGWGLSGSAVLDQPLPAVALDSDGYAIDVTTTDPSVLLRPDVVGATQAAVVDEGPASPAAAVIASGPHTTGLYAGQAAQAAASRARGLQYQWLMMGAPYPQFELRLAGGGALVLYALYLDTTNQHPSAVAGSTIPAAGSPIPVPAAVGPLLDTPSAVAFHAVYANWVYQFAAVDPPSSARHAKVRIIGAQDGLLYAHAY